MGVSCVMITLNVSNVWHNFTILTKASVWLVMKFLIIARNAMRKKDAYSAKLTNISPKMALVYHALPLIQLVKHVKGEISVQVVTQVHIS